MWLGGGYASDGVTLLQSMEIFSPGVSCGTPAPTNTLVATATNTPNAATATPTCLAGGGGLPGPWANGAPSTLDAYGAASASDGTVAYYAGGYSFSSCTTNVLQRYNPATNTWTTLATAGCMSEASLAYSPTTNKLYLFGGADFVQRTVYNTLYIYDMSTNTWSTGASCLT